MGEVKSVKGETALAVDIHLLGNEHELIGQHFRSINELLAKSQSTFQKLYNRKEKVLIENLHEQFNVVSSQLQHYEAITSPEYIEEKCKEKREELQQSRFEMLRDYMAMTSELATRKKELAEAGVRLQELKIDLSNARQLFEYVCEEHQVAEDERRELASQKTNAPLFATEPVEYLSPYAIQSVVKDGKQIRPPKQKPRFLKPFAAEPNPLLEDIRRLYT